MVGTGPTTVLPSAAATLSPDKVETALVERRTKSGKDAEAETGETTGTQLSDSSDSGSEPGVASSPGAGDSVEEDEKLERTDNARSLF